MSSPFASLLGTNYCPKDTEIVQIRDFLIDPLLRLKRLDDEIAVMQKALDTITEERDTLRAYVEAHKALISPFRQLPVDIIEAIFLACLPTHRNCVMSAREAPVILGRICRSWRIISQSFPPLWSSLHIVEPRRPYHARAGLYEAKISQRQEVAITWLQRSGTCPLSISLVDDNIDAIPGSLVNLLIPFAPRWQEITLSVPSLTLKTLSCLTENDVPLLKDLAKVSSVKRHQRWTHCSMLMFVTITDGTDKLTCKRVSHALEVLKNDEEKGLELVWNPIHSWLRHPYS
jgi:hypothetical protein